MSLMYQDVLIHCPLDREVVLFCLELHVTRYGVPWLEWRLGAGCNGVPVGYLCTTSVCQTGSRDGDIAVADSFYLLPSEYDHSECPYGMPFCYLVSKQQATPWIGAGHPRLGS
jgi:hypothetical protein